MDSNTSPPCPGIITVRRNPPRRARATPQMTPKSFVLPEISVFPNNDVLPPETPQKPSTSPENENLKVFLRIRPLSSSPIQAPRVRGKSAWPQNPVKKNVPAAGAKISKSKNSSTCVTVNDSQSVTLSTPVSWHESKRIKSETYGGFSHVFSSGSSQFQVYERMMKPLVEEFLGGKSGMLAALGPSGSGKTHTVFGTPRDPGMVPLALRHIFEDAGPHVKQPSRTFYVSIFEICSERGKAEKLFDLLSDGGEISMQQSSVKGLKEVPISNKEQAESLIAQATLKRATAMTNTNSQSSAVLTIIDLAGAEREKRTGNQGARLHESNFINNTLMVFGLCLRSLLEHQKNRKKPLQKHFQSSMLTRYLRDYLEGKKRMSLILTAKPGEEDYLDTSYLLRQASPYMQIKYNEVEPSNIVPKKRHYQGSSIMDDSKLSPLSENLKRMRLVSEHTKQNDKNSAEERENITEDSSAHDKLDANSSVSLKSEFDRQVPSERSHIIMQNFAKVIWNVLKQYNSKLKVAEMEIESLKESIVNEKTKYWEIETQLNDFKANCTCCKVGNIKNDAEYCSSVSLVQPHISEQQVEYSFREFLLPCIMKISEETFHSESSFLARVDQSDEDGLVLSTSCTQLCSENSDREAFSLTKPENHSASEVDDGSKILSESSDAQSSSDARLDHSDERSTLGTSCTQPDANMSDRKLSTSLLKAEDHNTLEVEAVRKRSSESFDAQSLSEVRLDLSDEELTLGASCRQLDCEKSDREISISLSKAEDHNASEIEAVRKIPTELFVSSSSTEDDKLDPLPPPKDVSSTKTDNLVDPRDKIGVDISRKPPKPKRTLMPSSSMLSRDLSTFDLCDESEKLKGNRGTRKLSAHEPQRSNGSLSLLHLLQCADLPLWNVSSALQLQLANYR
ncbi:hypothetical protein V8G54_005521 [Vigna mungo]|uniref:Kinesin motor domain-containing protein n=1 Tax=Vigna mungo TaxID=3915 RepID=A0AAQ3S755_VIGMU